MRILICTSLFDVAVGGGAARSASLVAAALAAAGHTVRVLTTGKSAGIAVRDDGVAVEAIAPYNLYWIGNKNSKPIVARAIWQLIDISNPMVERVASRAIREFKPDVVHTQKLRGLSPSVWRAASSVGIPVVHTARDYELLSPEGTLSGRLGRMVQNRSVPTELYASTRRRLSRYVAIASAPSRFTLDLHLSHHFFPNAEAVVLPNSHGVSEATLRLSERSIERESGERLRLLFVGRFEHTKGIAELCSAVARLSQAGAPVALTAVGWGSLQELLTARYAGSGSVRILAPQFGAALQALYQEADALVVPSRWHEVFGNVVVEAAARGLPAIVSNMGGLPELVKDGITGWHFDWDAPDALEEAILRALGSRQRFHDMRIACMREARAFTTDRLLTQLEDVYAQAVHQLR